MTSFDGIARLLGRLGRGASLAARTALPVDTNPVPADWTHVTKVDPEDDKKLPLLYPLYLRHTSAVSVGGSADVTATNTEETFELLAPASVPVFHEPSGPRHVTPRTRARADLLAIPEVLNGDSESLVGQLGEATEYVREEMVPETLREKLPWLPAFAEDALADFATSWLLADAVFEAYVIQNPDSAAAREANVAESDLLAPREAKQRAMAAERHLESELLYLEYSGTFGGDEAVETLDAISDGLTWSRLWYGGGIDSRDRARAILDAGADTVVVGDAFHRVADEERELCQRAADALDPDASAAAVREWVGENVAVADSNAAAYLATIPGAPDPERLARRYLTATVRAWLCLRARREASGDERGSASGRSLRADLRRALGADLFDALAETDAALVRRNFAALLGTDEPADSDHITRRTDGSRPSADEAVATHLALALPP
ncbi:heptaprenylglyceryl phosphate synthase [Halorussus gelatinilyticus]|uniref:phosphoglycerol geranylgeranyltransferase n=1 Tax=Halorussus gelatinilyticus TaxID=2937524 RepID=A0A8U0IGQ2_9EURY|nr:heptaprenylglyceryl phosphate synthase [Halorussus gelatinilyticus]UPV99238.1 heptaprenylglyceryl phosphate synthase [Halorussus gelatinilyticus]